MMAVLAVVSASGGCDTRRGRSADTISRAKFVAANVALRTGDTTEVARAGVLREHKVTEDQLRGFVTMYAGDTLLAGVWDEIAKGVEAKRPETDVDASVAPVQPASPASPDVVRELPRVMRPRTRVRVQAIAKDTAADGPATPAPDSARDP